MTNNISQRRIAILGAGESGTGAAILAKDKGFDVFVSDFGHISPKYKEMLNKEGIQWEEGQHTVDRILASDEVVKSPGIADTTPIMQKVLSKNIPVISEIEFAGRYTDAKMICITGSNGKTTTTLLTYHILQRAGLDVGLAGNVGNSLALQVAREPHEVYVIELSSFQLDNMYDFKANIAVILNITPDHLDRYDYKMENYVKAKFRILQNMTPQDSFIYWKEDPVVSAQLKKVTTEAELYPFTANDEEACAAYIDAENDMIINTPATSLSMPRADLALNGIHNLYNSMAAGLSACLLNIRKDDIRAALSDFTGVEHRLEPAGTVEGVEWINDSKATNVNSCWYALDSMTKPTILILGGKDKGNDYKEILPLVKEKVKAIVAMGLHNEKIIEFFEGAVPVIRDTHSLADAVTACHELATSGDVVLLSPCCASFDLFSSYEDRGRQFKQAVANLSSNQN
ncbi:MAG: UDP-N-acetylmuramoyl-L-alanine--D-glutamate ligase [Muribaculaceae bacterium]|nr:UDP-N-acetylmuramoyl-L-alanine--D-glutamate ligase [Muribaculaceae bacterium]